MHTESQIEPSNRPAPATEAARIAAPAEPVTVDPVPGDGMWREPFRDKWLRRAVTIPALLVLTAVYLALLPPLLLHGLVVDTAKRRPQLWCRFHLSMVSIFIWHIIGIIQLFTLWVVCARWAGYEPKSWREWNRRAEAFWVRKVLGIAELFYGLRWEVEGAAEAARGPVLILARHASTLDTILPIKILSAGYGMVLRIVKKRELLLDPTVDCISHRLPRTFIRRGSAAPKREIAVMTSLLGGVGDKDAVVIFPEGTRFTPAKQRQVLARLEKRDPALHRRATALKNVLPPRLAGSFALMDRRPDMDVVFCAHTGLEGANQLEDVVHGALLRTTVKVRFFRVPAAEVPRDPEARTEWLLDWWQRVDRWIDANRAN